MLLGVAVAAAGELEGNNVVVGAALAVGAGVKDSDIDDDEPSGVRNASSSTLCCLRQRILCSCNVAWMSANLTSSRWRDRS